jgi:hypothetical protein
LTAIKAARDWCWTNGKPTLNFPDGRYCYDGDLELAKANWTVNMLGGQVWFESFRKTSGNALSLNGTTSNASGTYDFHFGGAHKANVRGNTHCSNGVYFNGLVASSIRVNARDSAINVLGDNTGSTPLVAAVNCVLDLAVPIDDVSTFDFTPSVGLYLAFCYACRGSLTAEGCGTSSTTPAIRLASSNGNVFTGGTAQSNNFGGVLVTSGSKKNTFIGMDCESNGDGRDWQLDGDHNVLLNCSGAATYLTTTPSANYISGDYNAIIGGEFNDLEIASGADHTRVMSANLSLGTITDSGSNTTFLDCEGKTDKESAALKVTRHKTNAGDPNTHVTADFIGDECFDSTNGKWYRANAANNSSWVLLN